MLLSLHLTLISRSYINAIHLCPLCRIYYVKGEVCHFLPPGCQISLIFNLPLGLMGAVIIESPQSGVTLCFQFVSAAASASASAAAMTFASHVKTV